MKPQRLPFAITQCWPAAGLQTWMTRGLLRAPENELLFIFISAKESHPRLLVSETNQGGRQG